MQDENRDGSTYDNGDTADRVRLRTFGESEERRQYHWLLLVPLLVLGYGFYTQFDRVREMLTPDPVVATEPSPDAVLPPVAPLPVASVAAPATETHGAPTASVAPPVDIAPVPKAIVQEPPPLPVLFAAPAEPVSVRTAGKAGLVQALRSGELRLASASDIGRWKTSHARNGGGNSGRTFDEHAAHMDAYIVQKDFEIPGGLAGADAVVFLLEPGAPFPRGDAGHSPILDIESGACIGAICRMLMSKE